MKGMEKGMESFLLALEGGGQGRLELKLERLIELNDQPRVGISGGSAVAVEAL